MVTDATSLLCFRKRMLSRLAPHRSVFLLLLPFVLIGCGSGGSGFQSNASPSPPQIISVIVNPQTAQVLTGSSQAFTVAVTGSGTYDSSVTWSINGVVGGNATYGTIIAGQYSAPAAPPNPSNITIKAKSLQDPTKSASATVTVVYPAVLNSITPHAASAGEQLIVDATQNVIDKFGSPQLVFPAAAGGTISSALTEVQGPQFTARVPFGATSGPVYMSLTPPQGSQFSSDSVAFTRLPNLRVHASKKDLSSGETLQLDWRFLGASTPSAMQWTADLGSISPQGLFHAPAVSEETYSRVTGCVENTNSCNSVLLRILPFQITPNDPIVNLGNTFQLDAVQDGSFLSPQWSVLAGGGSITSAGLFTAPTIPAQGGPVPISANSGGITEEASIAVSGAFPGLVNRVYDYADFTTYTPREATLVESVAVSGNRAYTITNGNPYSPAPSYEALDIYDISNPDQPSWIDAIESPTDRTIDFTPYLYSYGNTLFSIDYNYLVTYSLTSQRPTLTGILPIASPSMWSVNSGVLYVSPQFSRINATETLPIDLYDMTTGTVAHTHYELPQAAGGSSVGAIAGKGNVVYVSWSFTINNVITYFIGTYDISQSPPRLLSTVSSTSGPEYDLSVIGNVLFADSQVYDISNVTPVPIASVPIPLRRVWGAQGNSVLAAGAWFLTFGGSANYAVVDITSPSNPAVKTNVVDLMDWDVFNPSQAKWANNGRFYTADGTGGIGVYNATASGGPGVATTQQFFAYIYDQTIQQQILYVAAYAGPGGGELACLDVSGGTPSFLGKLFYSNDLAFAVQASGTTVYLGLADSLKVVDVSNPHAPFEVGSVAIPVNALALSGTTLFVGTGDGRLVVFDVSTPTSPKQIASLTMAVPNAIRLSGSLLLVAAAQNGLLVFDVSVPSSPRLLSHFIPSPSAPVWDVAPIGGSALMLAADSSGVVTIDISNPSGPRQLDQQQLPFLNAFPFPSTEAGILPAFSLASQNGLTYVGTTAGIMFAFDASVAAHPRLMAFNVVGSQDTDVVSAITPVANNLYVAVQGVTLELGNTVPENSIELYYPPAALSVGFPITGGVKRGTNPKLAWMSGRAAPKTLVPDRFGVQQRDRNRPN